jgi:hypothetical protein
MSACMSQCGTDGSHLSRPSKLKPKHIILAMQAGCSEEPLEFILIGSGCQRWLTPPARHHHQTETFSEKHALQQACIIGNMERFGVISPCCVPQRVTRLS